MNLNHPIESFDATVWAKYFVALVRHKPQIPTDEECMTTWFANALMRGYDEARASIRIGAEIDMLPDGNWHAIEGPAGRCACGPDEACGQRLRRWAIEVLGEAYATGYRRGVADAKARRTEPIMFKPAEPSPPDHPYPTTAYHPHECKKVIHGSDQPYNHGETEDGPFYVGYDVYCGRCHAQIGGVGSSSGERFDPERTSTGRMTPSEAKSKGFL